MVTTAIVPLSSEAGRSHLQESLFSWLASETESPAAETQPVVDPEPNGLPVVPPPAEEAKPDLTHVGSWLRRSK